MPGQVIVGFCSGAGRRLVDARSRCTGVDEAVVNLAFTHNCKVINVGSVFLE